MTSVRDASAGVGRLDSGAGDCRPASFHSDELRSPLATSRTEARPVLRSPKHLRLHPALEELNFIEVGDELNKAARLENQNAAEPIFITTNGTILAGFGRWRLAIFHGRDTITCIELRLSDDEALQFMLTHHQARRGWNAFNRIRLALVLEPMLQDKALANMQAGGKYKGSAKLPKAQHIDVREEISHVAGVCARNVSNVRTILEKAHPRILEALRDGLLKINRAVHWCRLPKTKQMEEFISFVSERGTNKVINQTMSRLAENEQISLDTVTLLDTLQEQERQQPGSITLQIRSHQRTIVLVGLELLRRTRSLGG